MVGEKRLTLGGVLVRLPFYFVAVLSIIPYYWMVIGAFKTVPELIRPVPSFIIHTPTLNNFYDPRGTEPNHVQGLFQRFEEVPLRFFTFFLNSLFVCVAIVVLSLLLASLAAYVLAKHRFPGRDFLFIVVLASMMVPWQVMFIPNFLTMKALGWINTFQALIVPALPKAVCVFFLRQYMLGIPDELLDAARVDGAGELRIWWQIIMPLVRPALAAMAIFVVLNEWNNFVWPLIIAQDSYHQTLPVALSRLSTTLTGPGNMGVIMAASLLTSLPAVAVFLAFQNQFIESVARSGLKG